MKTILNESTIRKIVEESVFNLMMESVDIRSTIGSKGHLSSAELINPQELFENEIKMAMQVYAGGKMVDLDSMFGNTFAYKIYKQYETAMMSKEGKKARGFLGWLAEMAGYGNTGQKIFGYRVGDNFIFGMLIQGYFMARYFAPASKMGMFGLIKDLCQYDNIIFAVTQDLSPMLRKLGIPESTDPHNCKWRGHTVTKDVFGTSDSAIQMGIKILDAVMARKRV